MDKIGIFKGKPISTMTRDELLDFATWAGKRIQGLEKIEQETQDYRIDKEITNSLT
jgi:hypothetical protein